MLVEEIFSDMKKYSGFPTWSELKEILTTMVEDCAISYDPEVHFVSYATMNAAYAQYSPEEYQEFQKMLREENIPVRNPSPMLWDCFEHVWYPENTKLQLPSRGTQESAGYDFYLPKDVEISDAAPTKIDLGVRWVCPSGNKFLMLRMRSKFSGVLELQCSGIIDADYAYNPDNYGEISIIVRATPGAGTIKLTAGERICQGIILPYNTIAIDVPRATARIGGFGSTDKQEVTAEDAVIVE